jgi:hypothetical protein
MARKVNWLDLARSRDDGRLDLQLQHGQYTTDGFRLHYDPNAQATICPLCKYCRNKVFEGHWQEDLPWVEFRVDVSLLMAVTKLALMREKNFPKVTICVGDNLWIEDCRTWSDMVVYANALQFKNLQPEARLKITVNPQYLRDALLGMQKSKALIMAVPNKMLITDGNRIAVIMPLHD